MYHLIQSKKNVIIILLHNFQTQLHLFKRFFFATNALFSFKLPQQINGSIYKNLLKELIKKSSIYEILKTRTSFIFIKQKN